MAVTKIHGIKSTVNKAIEYICNPAKTDENIFVSSFACAPETAALDFKYTLDHTTEQAYASDCDRENKAFHMIQAFEPGEVSYEEAHLIGKELADKLLEGKHSYVLTTHIDKGHVHNHIIFCAADNIDYKHYHDCKKSYWHIRHLSDQLCQEHGLSVIIPSKKRGAKYNEWLINKNETGWKAQTRKDINACIKVASTYEEFLTLMQAKGYEIKNSSFDVHAGKYISFRPIDGERFIRGSARSLGANFTKERIKERIENKKKRNFVFSKADKQLQQLIDTDSHERFANNPGLQKWAAKENLKIAAQTYNQMTAKNIHGFSELSERISSLQQLTKTTNESIVSIEHRLRDLGEIIKYTEQYQENKPFHDRYKKAKNPDLLLRKFESQILLFSGAERMLQVSGLDPSHLNAEKLRLKYQELIDKKKDLSKQYKTSKSDLKELQLIDQNLKKYLDIAAPQNDLSHPYSKSDDIKKIPEK